MQFATRSLWLIALVCGLAAAPSRAQVELYSVSTTSDFRCGGAVHAAGDVNGDGFPDVVVGAPSSGAIGAPGEAFVLSGRDGTKLFTWFGSDPSGRFGYEVTGGSDLNGDGFADVIVGAPSAHDPLGVQCGLVQVFSGRDGALLFSVYGDNTNDQFGSAVAQVGDSNGDGVDDLIIGAPFALDPPGAKRSGLARVCSGKDGSTIWTVRGTQDAEWFGGSVAGLSDVNGDGVADFIVGAPMSAIFAGGYGSFRVFSGANGLLLDFFANATDQELGLVVRSAGDIDHDGATDFLVGFNGGAHVYSSYSNAVLLTVNGLWTTLGASSSPSEFIDSCGDFDGDGFADLIVGRAQPNRVDVISGHSGAILASVSAPTNDYGFGRAVGALGDLNHDGTLDLVVGAPDNFNGDAHVYLLGASPPVAYCTAKLNSQACLPFVSSSGLLSLSVGADDLVLASAKNLNNVNGLLFWGHSAASIPFGGGTLCVQPPLVRTSVQNSGGNPPPSDCSGTFSFHFSRNYVAAANVPSGSTLHAQFWSRDPGYSPPINVGLSNALTFTVLP